MTTKIEYRTTHTLSAVLEVKTGLRVGAGKDAVEIGGVDSPVVKHPHNQRPYVPGSSIKGKLRSLLEWSLGVVEDNGAIYGSLPNKRYDASDAILRTFGTTHKGWEGGPTRLIVRDAPIDPDWDRHVVSNGWQLTEEKSEVTIDRLQGKAASMGPRRMERVPSGARFRVEILFKEYSVGGDNGARDRHCLNMLIGALRLLEQDALGGSGSRGYGKVAFRELKLNGRDIQSAFESVADFRPQQPPKFLEA